MNLVTIESQEEQKNIMEKLKTYEKEPAVYWISLDRKDKKSGWRWKYPGKFLKPLDGRTSSPGVFIHIDWRLRIVQRGVRTQNFEVQFSAM